MNTAKTTTKKPQPQDRCTYCGDEFSKHTRAEYRRALLATIVRCEHGCGCTAFVQRGKLYLQLAAVDVGQIK